MPLLRGTRPLKRWRYVAIFCEELMACAATVQVGPARQTFWAVLLRGEQPGSGPRLLERTRLLPRRGVVELDPGRLLIHDTPAGLSRSSPGQFDPALRRTAGHRGAHRPEVTLDLQLDEDRGIETVCPHGEKHGEGGDYVWTRKQAGLAARGVVVIGRGSPRVIEALAVIDDTAGYHARSTEWHWAAGVGVNPEGVQLAFNLVAGVNDPPSGSERTVWVAGQPHEVGPVSFAPDLSRVTAADGSVLGFTAEAQRNRHENLLLVRSEYCAPFGVFGGVLPGGIALAQGLGVMEYHRARW
jgi:hypothetical protein